jgi:hypothetical protein
MLVLVATVAIPVVVPMPMMVPARVAHDADDHGPDVDPRPILKHHSGLVGAPGPTIPTE